MRRRGTRPIHGGHFFLQEEWSNANGGCEPRAKPDSASFDPREPGRARCSRSQGTGRIPQGRIVSFDWFFGDGRTAFGRPVSHKFKIPGAYRVMLRATDSWGNWVFAGRTIRVEGRRAAARRAAHAGRPRHKRTTTVESSI